MPIDRRRLFAAFAGAGVATAGAATPAGARDMRDYLRPYAAYPMPSREAPRPGVDAASLGLRPDAAEDQSTAFQRAIDRAAAARTVLHLSPGFYRAGGLNLPAFAAIAGIPGATRIVMAGGDFMLSAKGSDHVSLSGLVLDGVGIPMQDGRGLVHLTEGRAARIADCEFVNATRNGITLEAIEGEVTGNTIDAADYAIFSNDARGLRIAGNFVRSAGNGGILVWRNKPGDDGTLIVDNRIENIDNKLGGSGQWGNGINVFRADNVIVRGNRINKTKFSAIRGNSASNIQIVGNTCSGVGEVALYSEFGFEGAVIANNVVDGASCGVGVTNFNEGGRLAVVQGNLIRNLVRGYVSERDPNGSAAVGIGIEADAAVTGNVIENVAGTGIQAGYGPFLRDVAITANVVRDADYGITISVAPEAGMALVADNLISGARLGAIVGREWEKTVTGDLSKDGAGRYAQLTIGGNRVR